LICGLVSGGSDDNRVGAPVLHGSALDETGTHEPINEPFRTGLGEAEDAADGVLGGTQRR